MPNELEALAAELKTHGVTSHIVTAEGGPSNLNRGPGTTESDEFTPNTKPVNEYVNATRKVTIEITEPGGKTTKWDIFPSKFMAEPLGAREILRSIDKTVVGRYQGTEIRRVA